MRIVSEKKPKALLLENVKGLLSHQKGKTFEIIKENLDKAGYDVFTKVLYAKDFGVPQNRPRIYFVCFKKSLKIKEFEFPKKTEIKTRLGDILEKDVDEKYTLSDKGWAYMVKRKKQQQAKGNGFGYSLFNEDSLYTSTISARYYKDGAEILIDQGKDKNPRRLTPREAARLQGFPDSFKITVSNTQFYKQMGNSVAVPVIRAIAKFMIKKLKL